MVPTMLNSAETWAILLLALLLDAAVGDPPWLYRAVPHPVALLGRLVARGEAALNDPAASGSSRFRRGLCLSAGFVLAASGLGWALGESLSGLPGGWLAIAVLASSLFAFRGLYDHVKAVADALERGLDEARAAVGHIVGRDPASLDRPGVARAAAESLAENFSDGVVAPAFWFALLGLPGLCAYKAINTLDSMIGHHGVRYGDFGRFAARLDDLVNWLPARLAGGLFVLAAALLPGADPRSAWRAMGRDAPRHRSPSAGWQEAALAGALGFALAGPRQYGAEQIDDHWMGDGRRELDSADLRAALRLYLLAGGLILLLVLLAGIFIA